MRIVPLFVALATFIVCASLTREPERHTFQRKPVMPQLILLD